MKITGNQIKVKLPLQSTRPRNFKNDIVSRVKYLINTTSTCYANLLCNLQRIDLQARFVQYNRLDFLALTGSFKDERN